MRSASGDRGPPKASPARRVTSAIAHGPSTTAYSPASTPAGSPPPSSASASTPSSPASRSRRPDRRRRQLQRPAGRALAPHPQLAEAAFLVRPHALGRRDRRLGRGRPPAVPVAQLHGRLELLDGRVVAVVRAAGRGLRQLGHGLGPGRRQPRREVRRPLEIVDGRGDRRPDAAAAHHGDLDRQRLGRHDGPRARAQLALPPDGRLGVADAGQRPRGDVEELIAGGRHRAAHLREPSIAARARPPCAGARASRSPPR